MYTTIKCKINSSDKYTFRTAKLFTTMFGLEKYKSHFKNVVKLINLNQLVKRFMFVHITNVGE